VSVVISVYCRRVGQNTHGCLARGREGRVERGTEVERQSAISSSLIRLGLLRVACS